MIITYRGFLCFVMLRKRGRFQIKMLYLCKCVVIDDFLHMRIYVHFIYYFSYLVD